ncbi:MAG: hypothetical protein R3E88_20320 [Myxococcota bacterium]|nr:hypothetical protein [Myxococcales bacterium]
MRAGRRGVARCAAAAFAALALAGCAAPGAGGRATDGDAIEVATEDGRLSRLARDFYARLENRRFNSISTFQDPGLHELFRSPEAYQDYYADLAYDLDVAHFEASRPTSVVVEGARRESERRVVLEVRFVGENGLPLRWWKVELVREDVWERDDAGRWWIQPGKV